MSYLLKLLGILRILGTVFAFYWGYKIGYTGTYDPIAQLHFMIPIIIVAISGTSGLEGLFLGNESAKMKGFEVGSNYQRQSAIALLSYAVIAVVVYLCNWGIRSELTILFTFFFLVEELDDVVVFLFIPQDKPFFFAASENWTYFDLVSHCLLPLTFLTPFVQSC